MRLDSVVREPRQTLQQILRAFDNNLTARDNFAPEGTEGHALISNGPSAPPSYQPISVPSSGTYSREQIDALFASHKHDGADITTGQVLPQFLGGGTRDATNFLRDDGTWTKVDWSSLTSVPTDFAGYGLDDDLAAALSIYYTAAEVDTLLSFFYTAAELDGGQLDNRYYTEAEVDALLAGKSDTSHTHTFASLTSKPTTLSGYGITDAIDGSGTSGKLAKFTAGQTIGNSLLSDDGTNITDDATDYIYTVSLYTIRTNTSDGSDNAKLSLNSGGAESTGRGALVLLHGNEHGVSPGRLHLFAGGTGHVRIRGDMLFDTDGSFDIGAASATRPNRIFVGGSGSATVVVTSTTGSGATVEVTGGTTPAFYVSGTQVVSSRKTGWSAPTATLSRTAVATGDTLATTVSHLAAVVADLRSHGLLGN